MDQKYDKMLYLAEQLDKKFEIFKPYHFCPVNKRLDA